MTKKEYLDSLRSALSKVTNTYLDNRIDYYAEMIDDRIEDGMTEEEAVASMESVDAIVEATKLETPLPALVAEKVKETKQRVQKSDDKILIIILAILASPIWIPILAVLFGVGVAILSVIFALIVSLFAIVVGFIIAGIALLVAPFFSFGNATTSTPMIISSIGAAFFMVGVGGLLYKPVVNLSKSMINGVKNMINWIKKKL